MLFGGSGICGAAATGAAAKIARPRPRPYLIFRFPRTRCSLLSRAHAANSIRTELDGWRGGAPSVDGSKISHHRAYWSSGKEPGIDLPCPPQSLYVPTACFDSYQRHPNPALCTPLTARRPRTLTHPICQRPQSPGGRCSAPQNTIEGEGSMVLRKTVRRRRRWSVALAGGGPSIPLPSTRKRSRHPAQGP